jgi:futalosine hydrolase
MKCIPEFCQMHILLVSATKFEIQPVLSLLESKKQQLHGNAIDVLITGVGQINTIYNLLTDLQNKKPDLVIQAGIAGYFNGQLILGETVLIKQDTFGDVGMEEKEKFTTLFDAGFAGKNDFPFTDGWLLNNHKILGRSILKKVKAITINKVSDSLLQKQQLQNHFEPDIESMEGAAFHYVCLQQKVPFIQIRSISNLVGERDKSKWQIKSAIINLNVELEKLIKQLQ